MEQTDDLVDGLVLFRFGTLRRLLTSITLALIDWFLLCGSHGLRFYAKLGRVRPVPQAYYESEKLFFCHVLVEIYYDESLSGRSTYSSEWNTILYRELNGYLSRLYYIISRLELIDKMHGRSKDEASKEPSYSKKRVFIVHGHDEEVKQSVARFLEKFKLEVVILHEQPNKGKTIIEKFENYSDVGFAVVLLTPDDFGGSNKNKKSSPRARQNVILELGFFIGKLGRNRVCALHKGAVELPSDLSGVLWVNIDEVGAWRILLAKEMKAAGLEIDMNKLAKI